jgi:hypothetical protein
MADMNGPLASASGPGSFEAAHGGRGFRWSIKGKRIEVISADHQNKPDLGVAIARQWFDVEHVDVIADLSNSAVGLAVVEVAKPRNKIVLVTGRGRRISRERPARRPAFNGHGYHAAATSTVKSVFRPGADTWFFITSDFAFGQRSSATPPGKSRNSAVRSLAMCGRRSILPTLVHSSFRQSRARLLSSRSPPADRIRSTSSSRPPSRAGETGNAGGPAANDEMK